LPGAHEKDPKALLALAGPRQQRSTSTMSATPKTDLLLQLRGRETDYFIYFNCISYDKLFQDYDEAQPVLKM
jgi:hypothetical protein